MRRITRQTSILAISLALACGIVSAGARPGGGNGAGNGGGHPGGGPPNGGPANGGPSNNGSFGGGNVGGGNVGGGNVGGGNVGGGNVGAGNAFNSAQGPSAQGDDRPIDQLGRAIFFDSNISNPRGISCASCHAPETGFSYPKSLINEATGTVPGIVSNRFASRKPMTLSYSWFVPDGAPFWNRRQHAWEGGFFADGRARDLEDQAGAPMLNPNEMNNIVHGLESPELVMRKVTSASYASLFKEAFGNDALTKPSDDIFKMIRQSIASFERSRQVSPFSSKYDAYVQGKAQLTPSELDGLRLFTGSMSGRPGGAAYKNAQCVTCHRISNNDRGHDFFSNWTFANIGVPRNPRNPFYKQTNPDADPKGYNPDGDHYVDLGLGGVLYPRQNLPPGNIGPGANGRGDFLEANGEFRVASLRNVDKRPYSNFVKCYMHNGVFKSLKEVVHFYNTRNLTTRGEVIDLTSANPNASLKGRPLWPSPEFPSAVTLQNPAGHPGSPTARIGNLGLTNQEENDIVAFLATLSDGYFSPTRRRPGGN